jgi:roadblock/LC7 domain-containing protein
MQNIGTSIFAVAAVAFLLPQSSDATQPIASGLFVSAGHYIQEFDGQTGSLVDNVTTGWEDGTGNTEFKFGPDNNLYGIGSNGWVYKYNFVNGQTSIFFKPSGDLGTTGLALGPNLNWYVTAGHYIQEFSQTGVFLGNVTTSWEDGTSNTELHFGPDDNIYGLGSNGWVYKYDFSGHQTSIFFKPTGDLGTTGLILGPDMQWYVAAGHYIQKFNGQTGTFISNETTSWAGGSSNTELQFGPGNDLYGVGFNGWIFKYDFASGQTPVFAKPTGDGGSTGLAFFVPEPSLSSLLFSGGLTVSLCLAARPIKRRQLPHPQ